MSSSDPNAPHGSSSLSHSRSTSAATQLSFESLLSWFGRFTPQFKYKLMVMKRSLALAEFEARMRETFGIYRTLLTSLAQVPKGPQRARAVYSLLDEELAAVNRTDVSCGKGCSACCRTFPKQITDDEASLLAGLVHDGTVQVDLSKLEEQVRRLRIPGATGAGLPCVFLGEGGMCRVYADRPGICRKTYVVSDAAECEKENGEVIPKIEILPELIVSAAMSVPETRIGWLSELVLEHIERFERKAAEAPGVDFTFPQDIEIVED